MKKKYIIPAIIFLFGLTAYGDSVKSEASKTTAYTGETITFRIYLETMDDVPPVSFPQITGALVEYAGRSTQSYSFSSNGQVSTSRSYIETYKITSMKEGKIRIPEIKITIAGKDYYTEAVTINIEPPQTLKDYKLEVKFDKKALYAGEPVTAEIIWHFSESVRSLNFKFPEGLNGDIEDMAADFAYRPNEQEVTVSYNGQEIPIAYGESDQYIRFKRRWVPVKAKEVSPKNLTLQFEGFKGYRESWGGLSREAVYAPYIIPGEGQVVRVVPLPTEGRTDDFSGIIGNVALSISAVPTEVSVGEPITLQIDIEGDVPADYDLPDLSLIEEMSSNFSFPFERSPGKMENGILTFIQTIRPKTSSAVEIPPLYINYFNSDSGTYEYEYSNNVPISVKPSSIATGDDMQTTSAGNKPEGPALKINEKGIRYNYDTEKALKPFAAPPNFGDLRNFLFFFTIILVVVLLCSIIIIIFFKKKKNINSGLLPAKISDIRGARNAFMDYLASTLGIKSRNSIPFLRKSIEASNIEKKWKDLVNRALDDFFKASVSGNEDDISQIEDLFAELRAFGKIRKNNEK